MIIEREYYLKKLIERKDNGLVKVITGIRRCGKSFLLFNLYYNYLLSIGVKEEQIIRVALDDDINEHLHDRRELSNYLRSLVNESEKFYIFLDEIQFVEGFEKVLNGLNHFNNVDIYVTGSNSKFLSTDILTEFRGRGDEIRVFPLSFSEFLSVYKGSKEDAWNEYFTYGGLPLILNRTSDESKSNYLKDVLKKTYISDVVERNNLRGEEELDTLLSILASATGSLTNPSNIANTFNSKGYKSISNKTITQYIDHLIDAFIIHKVNRYDVKGRKYIGSPFKYYFTDIGLRNAQLNFRQQEENHIMENIIYNELLVRGYNIDVGIVEAIDKENAKSVRRRYEIDFVCNQGSKRYYIQSAFEMYSQKKREQEEMSLRRIDDTFKKVIIIKGSIKPWYNEQGILTIGLLDFLLDLRILDF